MAEEFEGDLSGAVFWGADLTGATLRDVNLTGVRVSHAWLIDAEFDALIDRVVINGVDVTEFVNQRDPWYRVRSNQRPADVGAMRSAWAVYEDEWAHVIARVEAAPSEVAHRSVNGEWSFVQTLQHLVFAMDKWITLPVIEGGFHPIGLPNTGSRDFPFPGVDLGMRPSLTEALAARSQRSAAFTSLLASLSDADLDREVDVLENGPHPVRECILTVFEEEFWHLRYAVRDLDSPAAA